MCPDRNLNIAGKKEAGPPPQLRNHLFVIGIDRYSEIPRLENAVEDARDFAETLVRDYNFERENLILLENEAATARTIRDTFRALAQKLDEKDNLVIFFSGHGNYDKVLDQGYWIPVDAEKDSSERYISNAELATYLRAIRSFHTVLISDSCFSGTLFARSRDFADRVESIPSRWGFASGRNEVVSDGSGSGNSPFTENLLYFLKQSPESALPISELIQRVKQAVANNSEQTPLGYPLQDVGDRGGEFIFRRKNSSSEEKPDTALNTGEKTHIAPATQAPAGEKLSLKSDEKNNLKLLGGFTPAFRAMRAFQNQFLVADEAGWVRSFLYDGSIKSEGKYPHDAIVFSPGGQQMLIWDKLAGKLSLLGAGGSLMQSWTCKEPEESVPQFGFSEAGKPIFILNSKLFINSRECVFPPGVVPKQFFLQESTRNVCPFSIWVDAEDEKPREICDIGFFLLAENAAAGIQEFHFVSWEMQKRAKIEIPLEYEGPKAIRKIETGGPYVTFFLESGENYGYKYEGVQNRFVMTEYGLDPPENGPVWHAAGGYFIIGNPEFNPEGSAFRNYWIRESAEAGALKAFEYYSTLKETFFLTLFENGNLWRCSIDNRKTAEQPLFASGMRAASVFSCNTNESILFALADEAGKLMLIDYQFLREPQILTQTFSIPPGKIRFIDFGNREHCVLAMETNEIVIVDLPEAMRAICQ